MTKPMYRLLTSVTFLIVISACGIDCGPFPLQCDGICGQNRLTFSNCDGKPCGWTAETGSIDRVPTIHSAIQGMEMENGTTAVTRTFISDLSSLRATLVADCNNAGLEITVSNPGGATIATSRVPATDFQVGQFGRFALTLPITGSLAGPDAGVADASVSGTGTGSSGSGTCSDGGRTEIRLAVTGAGSCVVQSLELNPCN